jgi:hypothetical protein
MAKPQPDLNSLARKLLQNAGYLRRDAGRDLAEGNDGHDCRLKHGTGRHYIFKDCEKLAAAISGRSNLGIIAISTGFAAESRING